MTIRELIKNVDLLDIDGPINGPVTGITYDARRVSTGNVYFALQRGNDDGHEQIELAIERGASAIVCRRNGSIRQGATKIDVVDTRKALAQAAGAFYEHGTRAPKALPGYLTGTLPPCDRRDPTVVDRRCGQLFRGGRRSADVVPVGRSA